MTQNILDKIEDIKNSLATELEELHQKREILTKELLDFEKEIPELEKSLAAIIKIFGFDEVSKNKKDVLEIAKTLKNAILEYSTKIKKLEEIEKSISILEVNI